MLTCVHTYTYKYIIICICKHFPDGANGKESAFNARDLGSSDPWVGKIPWRREWLPTPVFLLGEFHGQRSLVGCSPWDHRESDVNE